ncbi:cinnamoyl-CoA reductase 1-like [Chenopodium quinoa]|uniref:NAD-dependent epimerase/dehydratase domain-containing protein n=1 Tax=Chenopodium quinoa TaxID=63459 RepID=A0A803LDU9_CHEQI|nr:cinnamoyl-CoA reductase 1-like [Chenopodium quinoa]
MEKVMNGEEKRVCVTGASGFIASWIVKLLLQRGYKVNATVRNLNDPMQKEHLLAMDGAEKRLQLFEADLLEEGSFDSAIHGCDGVFHTATPLILFSTNPEEEVIEPAVMGTLNVLASCIKTGSSVKRVIFTSSTAAVVHNGRPLTNETVVDETWFSSPEGCKARKGECYSLSKTLAEDAAWKFAKENGINLISVNPAGVIGPLLQPTINATTFYYIINLINGAETYPNSSFGWVHVKDVAEAHIRAFEIPSANGRYILSETVAHFSDIVKILHELYPSLKLPDKCDDDQPLAASYKISQDKAKTLGIEFIPLKIALKETVECLKEKFNISV